MEIKKREIYYASRNCVESEIKEMRNFISELQRRDLAWLVDSLFFDSKANICSIETNHETSSELWEIAEKHISQFEIGGTVGHGECFYDDLDEEIEQDLAPLRKNTDTREFEEDQIGNRIRLGKQGEEALAKWFSANNLGFVSICQNSDTFANIFANAVKRPDFLLLFDSLGLVAVDAKNIALYKNKYFSLPFEMEVRKAIAFERVFRMPLWYAFWSKDCWYWISALKAVEVGKQLKNRSTQDIFLSISIDEFIKIVDGRDLSKLYDQRLPSYANINRLAV